VISFYNRHPHGYVCRTVGKKWIPEFSSNERERKFEIDRLPFEDVVELFRVAFEREQEEEYNAVKTILERDLLFLQEAWNYLNSKTI